MENLETFLKSEEELYKKQVTEKSNIGLNIDYYSFNLAIKENVNWIEDAYENYLNGDIRKIVLELRVTHNKLDIIHWQNMIEILVEELLKRSNHEKN